MVDMEMDDEDSLDAIMPYSMADKPRYPYGLQICLCEKELDKLGLEPDCQIGDVIDLRCFAVVTSVSMNSSESGDHCRVELQIQKMALENEMDE